ncbi:hypothetical protein BD413DRAFT_611236 [Trametes elegans]|nr:hypothetical protein BD413DRAFT_611236 [Trametes elegans]
MSTAADEHALRRTHSEEGASISDASHTSQRVRLPHHLDPAVSRRGTVPSASVSSRGTPLHSTGAGPTPPIDWDVPLFTDEPRHIAPPPPLPPPPPANEPGQQRAAPPHGFVWMLKALLGFAGPDAKARRDLISVILRLSFGFAQVVVIITLLAYSAHHGSPTMPGKTEWKACEKPLGTWNALWIIRVALNSSLAYWNWRIERNARRMREPQRRGNNRADIDTELATQRYLNGRPHYPPIDGGPPGPRRQPTRPTGLSYEGTARGSGNTASADPVPQSRLHVQVCLLTCFVSLAWFLTAHVLAYTSVHTCRYSAPHLWWLTFGILCVLYALILEVFVLGLLVFILGPVLYLLWNIFLLCLGRHPLQNPHYIKPDIGKLPKSILEQIPLVLYIPTPPDEPAKDPSGLNVPPAAHAYPPATDPNPSASASAAEPGSTAPAKRRRFAFFRAKSTKKPPRSSSQQDGLDKTGRGAKTGKKGAVEVDEEDVPWDEMWEKSEYPFVRLEGNRAVCAICLTDFEEPRRVRGPGASPEKDKNADESESKAVQTGEGKKSEDEGAGSSEGGGAGETEEIQVEEVTEEERDALKLDDAGEGPQPLRLLMCGHAFHQTCVDPWLTDVSGRCPTCQRPVENPAPTKKGKTRRRT